MGTKIRKKVKSTPRTEKEAPGEPWNGNENQEKAEKYPKNRRKET